MFVFGIASGAAMIPYSVIKEVNPDSVKGSAAGGINFLVFGITAFIGPIYANHVGKGMATASNVTADFQKGVVFWIACCAAAIVVTFFLRETGTRGACATGRNNHAVRSSHDHAAVDRLEFNRETTRSQRRM